MSKYIQEMQNKYSRGHEQMEKRPYLVVYDSDDYVLGFPLTTKNKKTKPYPSHKNPTVSVDKISDIISEVMIDQLQFIYKNDFTNLSKTLLPDADYQAVIESFVSQIIKSNENPNKDGQVAIIFMILLVLLIIFLNFQVLINGLSYPQNILMFMQKCVL